MIKGRFTLICCICAVLVLLMLPLSACGNQQQEDAAEADGVLTPVKDDNGNITGYERKYHNDNGDVTCWDVYDADEQYQSYVLYEYDSENRLTQEIGYQADGLPVYGDSYTYSEDGVLTMKEHVIAKEGTERITYDNDGNEKDRITFDVNNNLVKYEVYQNGTWVEAELPTEAPTDAAE